MGLRRYWTEHNCLDNWLTYSRAWRYCTPPASIAGTVSGGYHRGSSTCPGTCSRSTGRPQPTERTIFLVPRVSKCFFQLMSVVPIMAVTCHLISITYFVGKVVILIQKFKKCIVTYARGAKNYQSSLNKYLRQYTHPDLCPLIRGNINLPSQSGLNHQVLHGISNYKNIYTSFFLFPSYFLIAF